MIKLWLSNKFRLLSVFGAFFAGLSCLILPWFVFFAVLALALFLDYLSFSQTVGGMGE